MKRFVLVLTLLAGCSQPQPEALTGFIQPTPEIGLSDREIQKLAVEAKKCAQEKKEEEKKQVVQEPPEVTKKVDVVPIIKTPTDALGVSGMITKVPERARSKEPIDRNAILLLAPKKEEPPARKKKPEPKPEPKAEVDGRDFIIQESNLLRNHVDQRIKILDKMEQVELQALEHKQERERMLNGNATRMSTLVALNTLHKKQRDEVKLSYEQQRQAVYARAEQSIKMLITKLSSSVH